MSGWEIKESENYIFNYQIDSYAEKDISKIIELQEKCYEDITNVIKVRLPYKIKYYLCNTPESVGQIYGDNEPCNGFADEPDKVYAVYNDEVKCIGHHEDAHVISYAINVPKSVAIREGFAMKFDKSWWGIDNFICTMIYYESGRYLNIAELIDDSYFYNVSCEISYPIVGAFTEFIIRQYGIEKYMEFYKYKDMDFKNEFNRIMGKSLGEVEDEFKLHISGIKIGSSEKDKFIKILGI